VESDTLRTRFFEVTLVDVAYCLFLEILRSKRGGEAKRMRVADEETRREGWMDGARVFPSAPYVLAGRDGAPLICQFPLGLNGCEGRAPVLLVLHVLCLHPP
jgi:hypothetical protein